MNCNWLYILLTLLAESNWTLAIQNNRQILKRSQQEQDGNRVEVTGWHRYRQRDSGSAKVNWDVTEHRGEKWNQVHQKLIIVRPIVYAIHFLSPASIYSLALSLFLAAVTWTRSAPLSRVPHRPPPREETGRSAGSFPEQRLGIPPISFVLPGTRLSFQGSLFRLFIVRSAVPRAFGRPFLEVVKLRRVVYLQWADIWWLFNFLTGGAKWTYTLYIVAMFNNKTKDRKLTTFKWVCLVNTLYKCKEK